MPAVTPRSRLPMRLRITKTSEIATKRTSLISSSHTSRAGMARRFFNRRVRRLFHLEFSRKKKSLKSVLSSRRLKRTTPRGSTYMALAQ